MKKLFYLLAAMVLISSCQEEPVLWKTDSDEQVISEYVSIREEFTYFAEILERTGLNSLLSVRGPFTMFLPPDSIMQIYMDENGYSSLDDILDEDLKNLALNHMVPIRVETGDVELGALRELNGLGDYLVTEFYEADIIVNKKSRIIKRDIQAANGVVHHIDRVIEPVSRSVFEILEADPSYSLFTEGLRRTGLNDTLQKISFPYGEREARTRFTILAVSDTTYERFGISNIDDLISAHTSAPDSITHLNNGFYRYMEYHCMGGTYYLNNLELGTNLYPILSYDNNISIYVQDDYKINLDKLSGEYTGFYTELCNVPAKNGTIHSIDNTLPVFEPEPTTIIWETTDHFELKQGDYFGHYYSRWFDGVNDFEDIKWEGDYMLYYFKDHDTGKLMNHDCLSMSGWWWIEVKTPKFMRGKYIMTSNLWANNISYAVWVDGVQTALIDISDPAESTSWGTFDWTTTERHTIKVVAKSPGLLFWDTIILTPTN